MPLRNEAFQRGELYHVFNRGADRAPIFAERGNYSYLLRLLNKYSERFRVGVICYCLMPNHYHLLLHQESDGSLSSFVNTLFNAYVQAYNRQQCRSGTLFEGRFRHVRVDRQEYLLSLMIYIHLNPVAARLTSRPEVWEFSDCRNWIRSSDGLSPRVTKYRSIFGLPAPYEYREMLADIEQARREGKAIYRTEEVCLRKHPLQIP